MERFWDTSNRMLSGNELGGFPIQESPSQITRSTKLGSRSSSLPVDPDIDVLVPGFPYNRNWSLRCGLGFPLLQSAWKSALNSAYHSKRVW
jgi:hypothetical protein